MKKILFSLLIIGAIGAVAAGVTIAYFSDTETSQDNTFGAGTLDLTIDGNDDPNVFHFDFQNLAPGDDGNYTWVPKNYNGTLDGKISLEISAIVNDDNGCTEPEDNIPDYTCGSVGGELGDNLEVRLIRSDGTTDLNLIEKTGLGASCPGGVCSGGWVTLNNSTGTYPDLWTLPGGNGGSTVKLEWRIPTTVGNIIQSDISIFDLIFSLEQTH